MNGYRIKGLPTPDVPESNSDVASWLQIVNLVRKSTVENETKVSKAGDVMTGDLTLSIDNDERRLLGCQDLTPGKSFSFLLNDAMNRLWYVLREPITMETTNGFIVKVKGEDICKIGTGLNPQTIEFFTDIRMNLNRISNLREPVDSDEAATKSYCDNRVRKIYNGYIPQMKSLVPDLVRIWRIDLRGRDSGSNKMYHWKLEGSADGENYTSLLTPPNPTYLDNTVKQFPMDTANSYNRYRLYCFEGESHAPGLSYMQLYIYSE